MTAPMTTVEVLIAARARIAVPEHWTTGTWARGKTGRAVDPLSRGAVRWCALGAVFAEPDSSDAAVLLNRAARPSDPVNVNDGEGGHEAVLALYDKTIALARAEAEGVSSV